MGERPGGTGAGGGLCAGPSDAIAKFQTNATAKSAKDLMGRFFPKGRFAARPRSGMSSRESLIKSTPKKSDLILTIKSTFL